MARLRPALSSASRSTSSGLRTICTLPSCSLTTGICPQLSPLGRQGSLPAPPQLWAAVLHAPPSEAESYRDSPWRVTLPLTGRIRA